MLHKTLVIYYNYIILFYMLSRIETYVISKGVDLRGKRIIAGFSGGPDSTLLMEFLLMMREKYGIFVSVMHLNHMERDEAGMEEEFVRNFCNKRDLPISLYTYDTLNDPDIREKGFEKLAREKRQEYFRQELIKRDADFIMTGHNADDRIETMLLNMERSTGPEGLCSMRFRNEEFIRPLLFLLRHEIREYLDSEGIEYLTDITNEDEAFGRNRIRKNIMPVLQSSMRNGYEGILETLDNLEEHNDFRQTAYELLRDRLISKDDNNIILDIEALLAYNMPTVRVFILHLLREIGIISSAPLDELIKIMNAERKTLTYEYSGVIFRRCYGKLEINGELKQYDIPEIVELKNNAAFGKLLFTVENGDLIEGNDDRHICLPEDAFSELYIRTRRPGDRFIPFGMKGAVKLKDFLINEKVPADMRDSIPLLVNERNEILWVAGFRRTGLYPVREKECKIVRLKET